MCVRQGLKVVCNFRRNCGLLFYFWANVYVRVSHYFGYGFGSFLCFSFVDVTVGFTVHWGGVVCRSCIRCFYHLIGVFHRPVVLYAESRATKEVIIAGHRDGDPLRWDLPRGAASVCHYECRSSKACSCTIGRFKDLVRRRCPTFLYERVARRQVGVLAGVAKTRGSLAFFSFFLLSTLSRFKDHRGNSDFNEACSFVIARFVCNNFTRFVRAVVVVARRFARWLRDEVLHVSQACRGDGRLDVQGYPRSVRRRLFAEAVFFHPLICN